MKGAGRGPHTHRIELDRAPAPRRRFLTSSNAERAETTTSNRPMMHWGKLLGDVPFSTHTGLVVLVRGEVMARGAAPPEWGAGEADLHGMGHGIP